LQSKNDFFASTTEESSLQFGELVLLAIASIPVTVCSFFGFNMFDHLVTALSAGGSNPKNLDIRI
jgi:hypothetical protein